jgi:uncharacterized protein (DUF1684 family)
MTSGSAAGDALALLDWKRRVFDLYAAVRAEDDPRAAWRRWREERDALFRGHPASPLPEEARAGFGGCSYFDYEPSFRVVGDVLDAEPLDLEVPASTGGLFRFSRAGTVRFALGGETHELELAWNEGYGGGLLLAFRDGTSGGETYGGGRYLLDTVKGSELGFDRERRTLALDFNFAYNPSCSYDPRWACPLAPPANTLPVRVTAGERHDR